jgi:hypothetical protein
MMQIKLAREGFDEQGKRDMEAVLADCIELSEKEKLEQDVTVAQKESIMEYSEQQLVEKALLESKEQFEKQFVEEDEEALLKKALQDSANDFEQKRRQEMD